METIEILTSQNVRIEYDLASLRDRMLAFSIDVVVVGISYLILVSILSATIGGLVNEGMNGYFVYGLLPVFGFMIYQLSCEVLRDGQSFGKSVMSIKVIRLDGKEPSLSDYLLRAAFHLVDSILCLGVVASLLVGSSPKRQRLGDLTANTTVIRTLPSLEFQLEDIASIDSLENYQPQFPEVKQLKEEDMLLIKSMINRHKDYQNEAHRKVVRDTVAHLQEILQITNPPKDDIQFLKTLIRDYIVLTR
ncbi:MAG: RDD family protein [Bacteroidota bacterium]